MSDAILSNSDFVALRKAAERARRVLGWEGGAVLCQRVSGVFRDVGWCLVGRDHITGEFFLFADPKGWEPGIYAVTEKGMVWRTVGGDDYNGAEKWLRTPCEGVRA